LKLSDQPGENSSRRDEIVQFEDSFQPILEKGLAGVFDKDTGKRGSKPITINTSHHTHNFGSPIPSPKSHKSILSLANMKYAKEKVADLSQLDRPSFGSSFGNLEDVFFFFFLLLSSPSSFFFIILFLQLSLTLFSFSFEF